MAQILAILSNPEVITVVTIVVEGALRLIPSQKPLSILHVIGNVSLALGNFLDKVLPQTIAPSASSTTPPASS